MILTADIGASKVKIAAFQNEDGGLLLKQMECYLTKDFNGFLPILNLFLKIHPQKNISAISIGAAGIVERDVMNLTNLDWSLTKEQVKKVVMTAVVFFLNDVEAHGYGLKVVNEKDLISLQRGQPRPGNKAFVAIGTGLGESILVRHGNLHVPFPTEGGHTDFGPRTEEESQLLSFLRRRYSDHVSWERVVSGRFGFRNLFDFLNETNQIPSDNLLLTQLKNKQEIGQDLQNAADLGNPVAVKIMNWFVSLLGSETGNLGLKAMAVDGVYLGGGIARRHAEILTRTDIFISAFNAKGRMKPLLQSMPVHLVMDQNLAVRGLAHFALGQLTGNKDQKVDPFSAS